MTARRDRPSPLQNRIDPFGAIVASSARGAWMGNRGGPLHQNYRLVRESCRSQRWICCRLAFRNRRREVMRDGRYTELFFLDEATAFAAGHRPCAECRRADYNRFRDAWAAAFGDAVNAWRAEAIDARIAADRRSDPRGAATGVGSAAPPSGPSGPPLRPSSPWRPQPLDAFAVGLFILDDGDPTTPLLRTPSGCARWSFEGYVPMRPASDARFRLMTPAALAAVIAAGYVPQIDASAFAAAR